MRCRRLAVAMTGMYDGGRQAETLRLMQRIPVSAARGDLRTMQNLALCQLSGTARASWRPSPCSRPTSTSTPDLSPALRGRTKTLRLMARLMTGLVAGR